MLTELYLAGKYLRPRRNMVSIIAFMSILGVMLGVTVLIVVMAVMTGFTDTMKAKLIDENIIAIANESAKQVVAELLTATVHSIDPEFTVVVVQ